MNYFESYKRLVKVWKLSSCPFLSTGIVSFILAYLVILEKIYQRCSAFFTCSIWFDL